MKQGDLVMTNEFLYPQYKGMLGVLGVRSARWIVFIDNKWHPYIVDQSSLELVNEAR